MDSPSRGCSGPSTRVAPRVASSVCGPRNTQRVIWRRGRKQPGLWERFTKSMLPAHFGSPSLPPSLFIAHKVLNYVLTRSPVCCIYHKPRAFGESSSECDSDSDSGDSRHDHPYRHRRRHNRHRNPHRPSSNSDRPSASSRPTGNTHRAPLRASHGDARPRPRAIRL